MPRPTKHRLLITLLLIFFAAAVNAEEAATDKAPKPVIEASTSPVVLGTAYHFESQVLGEERTLNVLLPVGYDEGETRYPVIYLLDGAVNEDYHHVAGLVQFLSTYQLMPPSIVVGLANVDRYRDFSHETKGERYLQRVPNAGGSGKFMQFLRQEAQPFIDANFRTSGRRLLIGQSMGGLVASEIFFHQPDLFDHYFIVSPSLWWDDSSLIEGAAEAMKAKTERKGVLVLSLGTEGEEMQAGVDRFLAVLEAHAPATLEWHYLSLPDESHATILHRAIYQSIEILYGKTHPGM